MRTTLTLEPDVAAKLKKEVAKGKQSFKSVVNEALRRGLAAGTQPKRRFVQRTWNGGPGLTWEEMKQQLLDEDLERYR